MKVQVKQQVKQAPVEILQGPAHRDDGYQMREEWGLPVNDAGHKTLKELQGQYAANAEQYKSQATQQLQSSVADARRKLGDAPRAPGYKDPAMTTVWAAGDGDKPYAYKFPTSAMPGLIKSLNDTDYYGTSANADGSYGVQFKEYGKEGYDALNEATLKMNEELAIVRNKQNAMAAGVNSQIDAAGKAITEAESGGYAQIADQYRYLSNLFGNEMAAESVAWQKKMAENSDAIQSLVAGGVLTVKKGKVL